MVVDQQPKIAQPVKVTDLSAVIQRFKETWQGVTNWFTPGEPIAPIQPEPEPRQRQVQVGQNIIYVPRAGESTSFEQLRFFASNYDVARLCIQQRKGQMAGLEWDIVAKEEGEGDQYAEQIKAAKAFLEYPDRQHDWPTWLGMLIEDRLAIDAVTIYPRPTRGGGLYALELIDGATLKVLVDYRGRVPDPPAPAYQQILWGTPRGMWSADQILYLPQNVRTHSVYGWSEIEGILYTVNTALRKRMQDLAHFTESNIPRAFMGVPESWTVDQIRKYQEFLDEWLAGDIARRSRIIMAPAGGRGQIPIHEMTEFSGDPQFDTWLLKITCAAFHITPAEIGFTDDVNRATSQGQENVTYRTGINPLARLIASIVNRVLSRNMGRPQLQFKWIYAEDHDELKEAQVDEIQFRNGALPLDEWREKLGRKPYGVPPFLLLASGPVMIDQIGKEPPVTLGPDGMPVNDAVPPGGKPRGEGINQDPAEGNDAGGDDAPSSGSGTGGGAGDTSPLAGGNEGGKAAGSERWAVLVKGIDPADDAPESPETLDDPARPVAYQAARDDLRRWRQVAVKAVRSNLPQRSFQTEHIPPHLYAEIVGELDTLTLIAQPDRVPRVQATFAKALEVLNQAEGPRSRAGSRQ